MIIKFTTPQSVTSEQNGPAGLEAHPGTAKKGPPYGRIIPSFTLTTTGLTYKIRPTKKEKK